MMVLLRAFVIVLVGVGAGVLHHELGKPIRWDIGENEPLPEDQVEASPASAGGDASAQDPTGDADPGTGADANESGEDQGGEATQEAGTDAGEAGAPELTYNDLGVRVDVAGAYLIYEMMLNGEAAIVDARRAEDYAEGHIPGAFNLRPGQFQGGNIPEDAMFMAPEAPVLIYCQGGDCEDSDSVARSLRDMGFKRLHVFDDGFPAWVEAGYDVDRGGL